MKTTTLVYCGEDGEAGKALAASLRDGKSYVVMCAANSFVRADRHADRVAFTSDVPQRLRQAISAAHGLLIEENIYTEISENLDPLPFITQALTIKRRRGRPRKAA